MKQLAFVFLVVIIMPQQQRPRFVNLDKELLNAVYVDYVKITGYKDGTILFTPIDGYEGYCSNKWMNDDKKIFHPFDKDKNFAAKGSYYKPGHEFMTETWPLKGDSVLIVIDTSARVSLFAKKQGDQYRFWSPRSTGSVAVFTFNPPTTKIPPLYEGQFDDKPGKCWDGCLLPIDSLVTYGRGQVQLFTGTTLQGDGKALFIWDYADSAIFILDGITQWDAKYLNKHIAVEGILVQYIEGRPVIKNWKIRSVKPSPDFSTTTH